MDMTYFRKYSDEELKRLVTELHLSSVPEDALIRKVVTDFYGHFD